MKNIRRRIAAFAAVAVVVMPLLFTVYLLFWSPNDLPARQTGKQRVFGATYMTMNNPYFQMLDTQIQGLLELNGKFEKNSKKFGVAAVEDYPTEWTTQY